MNTIVKYANPVSTLIDELFNETLSNTKPIQKVVKHRWPKVDIVEYEKEYKLYAEVPGMSQEDIKITIENGVLTLKGEKKQSAESDKENGYSYFERSYGEFTRSFNLPETVNEESIAADLKNGLLTLTIAKAEKKLPREISIS